jgi:hypothetical protein
MSAAGTLPVVAKTTIYATKKSSPCKHMAHSSTYASTNGEPFFINLTKSMIARISVVPVPTRLVLGHASNLQHAVGAI